MHVAETMMTEEHDINELTTIVEPDLNQRRNRKNLLLQQDYASMVRGNLNKELPG